jgi:uncharacterized protein (DUF58 family)
MADIKTEGQSLLEPALLRKLERLVVAAKRVQLGASKGERRSRRKGQSTEFADYRDYVQGDDLRHVDWNIFGRLDALYLKLFEEQEDLSLHLLIDASLSMDFGTPKKIDFARRLAAALGYISLVSYDRVCAGAFTGEGERSLTPLRGKLSARKLFAFLEDFSAEGSVDMEQSVRTYFMRNHTKGVAVLISDFFHEEGFEACLQRLAQSGSEAYAIHVMAPEEMDPQLSGDLKLVDSESKAISEISVSRGLLKRYAKNRDGFCESVRSYCRSRNIAYFLVSSETPLERLTLDILRRGGMLR